MIAAIRAEITKLFTVRSTYIISIVVLVLIAIVSFYFEGYRGISGSPAATLSKDAFTEIIRNTGGMIVLFVSIIAMLNMAHEYRYNMIMHTLTINARRARVLISKTLVLGLFGVIFGVVAISIALGGYLLGVALRDASLPAQDISWLAAYGKIALYFTIYALLGLLITTIVRSIVAAIAIIFIVPTTIEPLFGLLLKENGHYLPFRVIDNVLGASITPTTFSTTKIIILAIVYIAVLWLITFFLFLRRDAN